MSISDLLISGIIYLIKTLLLPILPISIGAFTISDFSAALLSVKSNLIYGLSGISFFMPVSLILSLTLLVILAEFSLMLFKMGVFIINLVRGSGA
jgi:hypothetical protein